jgi:hypothetical protein
MTALFCAAEARLVHGQEREALKVGVQLPITGERASAGRLIVAASAEINETIFMAFYPLVESGCQRHITTDGTEIDDPKNGS